MIRNQPMTEGIYYILLSLLTPTHGYGIIQKTLEMTGGRLELGAGTLYGAINNLLDKGWIALYSEEKESRKKKEYVITRIGRAALEEEMERLSELLENGKTVMENQKETTVKELKSAEMKEPGGIAMEEQKKEAEDHGKISSVL